MSRRWIAQRALTREWLHWDLPIDAEPSRELSGVGSARFTVTPGELGLSTPDRFRMFEPWSTLLYLEESGRIRWGGIVISTNELSSSFEVEVASFATYPHGQPWAETYSAVETDPVSIIRHIWTQLQSKPDGNLGVTVTGSSSFRRGTRSTARHAAARAAEEAAKTALDDARFNEADEAVIERLRAALDTAKEAREAAAEQEREDGGEYRLDWWDNPDCGAEIDAITDETPLEWVETHAWNADRTDVVHRIRVAERIGAVRDDLRFVQGENVVSASPMDVDGARIASEVMALGAGEGKKSLRVTSAARDGRLRRTRTVEAKDIRTRDRLAALARATREASTAAAVVDSIVVTDHPNARIGSWELGDVITVQLDTPWSGRTVARARIVADRSLGPGRAGLTLRPDK